MDSNHDYKLADMKVKIEIESIDIREVKLVLKGSKTDSYGD
jgi:hypothetical protein